MVAQSFQVNAATLISVAVTPPSATLYGGQTQQFTATVSNTSNTAVTWTISPASVGTISAEGLYTASATISTQQVVTVTATSQADTTQSASATVTLTPTQCTSNGYSYQRTIVIDHTKVPNTDQTNFPFLFNTTDPLLATTANGGHVTNPSGYDIVFASDPAGQNILNFEMEEYNPVTGQVIAWIRIPTLSHATNTVLYMFYGNSSITASQQNPTGVWDANYMGVWHLPNDTTLSANDSTINRNNGIVVGATATTGKIDGGLNNPYSTSGYIDLSSTSLATATPSVFSLETWVNLSGLGAWPAIVDFNANNSSNWGLYVEGGSGVGMVVSNRMRWLIPSGSFNTGWNHIVATWDGQGPEMYLNGVETGSTWNDNFYENNIASAAIGLGYSGERFNGLIDEVRVSTGIARSADWIATEYSNQNSPSTFYALHAENAVEVVPDAVNLYDGQHQQFTTAGACGAAMIWSMPSGSPGTLSATGLYIAPASIETQQTVTITATTLGVSSTSLSSTVTLMPPVSVSVTPSSATLYGGQTQQFTANVVNTNNTAVTWTITPAGVGAISTAGLYTAPTKITAQQTVTITATSQADTTQSASATITLAGIVTLPSVSISVTPSNASLYSDQTQQFAASVTNSYNTAVTWTISPAGMGTISSSGLYTAPAAITTQQTVTITAASQANPTQSASATIGLSPTPCGSNGYSYVRSIAIDHTKVPNTDQTSFPFLFNTTDPAFASTVYGGHVSNPNGYDILFTSDPAGQNILNYEMEEYNPSAGQVIAWVRIPILSHSSDTVLYLFYGNPSINAPQQNPAGVWDSNYGGVWHLAGYGALQSFPDSTANGNTATVVGSVSATAGPIGNSVALSGNQDYIDAGNNPSVLPTHTGTFSTWVYYNAFATNYAGLIFNTIMGNGNNWAGTNGTLLANYGGTLSFDVDGPSGGYGASYNNFGTSQWYSLTGTWDGSTTSLYVNGALVASNPQTTDASPAYDLTLGVDGARSNLDGYVNGSLEEARVSGIARSADWVATEYNNQSQPSIFYAISSENEYSVSPAAVTLNASQSQQLTATSICNSASTWSMPAGAPGLLSVNGLYTAPDVITTQQIVTITATSLSASANSATAVVTLMLPVAVSVAPGGVTLTNDQTQLFTASVVNTDNTAVTWTIAPTGFGSVDTNGIYTAPPTIGAQQTVTITATSQENPSKSASATITLAPTQCASSGFGYQRVIVIDHTKVPNTDQTNFPFLFNTTDPDLASTTNGGHVASFYGYDIIFSLDPNGLTKLDDEMEEYNPITGQVIAWIRIPTLSHSADTVIYVFYGNSNITTSQQNPTSVWDNNYTAVYHLANTGTGTAGDSTSYGNNGTLTSVSAASGEIDGAASLNGASSYIQIPESDFPTFPTGVYDNVGLPAGDTTTFSTTFGVWFRTASAGGILNQSVNVSCGIWCLWTVPMEPGDAPDGSWDPWMYIDESGRLNVGELITPLAYNDNNWHYAVWTFATSGTQEVYVDGQNVASSQGSVANGYSPDYSYFIGAAYTIEQDDGNWNWLYFNGNIDEVTVSNAPRSGDWIQTEYNNQGSPSTFYTFYPRSAVQIAPSAVSLYASQSQQFAVPGTCDAAVSWTMPSGALGSLTSGGLYTAPETVAAQQTVAITASSQASGATIGSASVTLLPPPPPITLTATAQSPYTAGSSQAFTATLLDQDGTPENGVAVTFTVVGANSSIGSGTTGNDGVTSYAYIGANSGNDTIQATAVVNGQVLASNSISASWIIPVPPSSVASVKLTAPPTLGLAGLVGAFTDNNGAVIEPIAIGGAPMEYIVPAGATQLQLGVDSADFANDGGPGFVVAVNGASIPVQPTAMPWTWVTRGLNNNYQYGLYNPNIQNGILDGTSPVVAATGLTQGASISIAYQSGAVSANYPARLPVNANGDQNWITGVQIWQGVYFPTLYTTASSYPLGQPITFNALVTDASGTPMPNIPVMLNVTGANAQQLQATTDSTGTAAFMFTGLNAGTDNLQAQAFPPGTSSFLSGQSSVTWSSYATPPAAGTLQLQLLTSVEDTQGYDVFATDASGSPVFNANVGLYVWGIDKFSLGGTTDITGHAFFRYNHFNPNSLGSYNIVAVDSVNRNVVFSNVVPGQWTGPTSSQPDTITIGITAQSSATIGAPLQLNGSVTDSAELTPTDVWSQVSGPGTVTFANPSQAVTTATFSDLGRYVLQLSASDASGNSGAEQFTVTVNPAQQDPQGWVGSPAYGSTVTGVVPITLAPGIAIQSGGVLSYYPTNNPVSISILPITASSGTIGTLDTTVLPNGSYWIQLFATDTNGDQQYSLILVTVAGNYKPGRVTATVTDLVVPATGLAINIQRTYDSLNAGTSSDFGYGWSLGINVNLTVDPQNDVTFTLGGQRRTFYFTPQQQGCNPLLGCVFPWYWPIFTPQPGLHGTLTSSAPGCADGLDILTADEYCQDGSQYVPPGYIYTDPNGTAYTISAAGNLQSIRDRSGNGLTITANGITSSTGLNVPFVRDASNRITQITDPQGNIYSYGYDANGNLATVTYPATPQAATCPNAPASNTSQYTYHTELAFPYNHYYEGGTDGRCNPLPVTAYYDSTTDSGNSLLDGRLLSVTDAFNSTTSYAYNLSTTSTINGVSIPNTGVTTITYPDNSTSSMVYDSYGDLLQSTDPNGNTTTDTYDANHNLISVTDPLGNISSYTYDQNGNKTSSTYPATPNSHNTTSTTTYNQYSEPTSTTDELGNARTFNYDANYNPQSVTDSIGTLASFIFNPNQTLSAGAIGYDITVNPAMASQFAYDANGNMISRTDALGRATSYVYNSLGQKTSMVTPTPTLPTGSAASTTTYAYDPFGNLTQTVAPLSRTTSSTYDANGNKLSDTDALGHVTGYQYDALNRLAETDYPDGTKSTRSYDFRNNVIDEIDQAGNDTHHAYDVAGRLITLTSGYGSPTPSAITYAYDNANRKIAETDALGHNTTYTYDNAGRLVALSGVKGNIIYAYDDAGNRISQTDANHNTTRFQYDARKRLIKTINPDSTAIVNTYDGPGNLASTTDQAGAVVQYTYDAANQLKTVVQLNHPNPSNNTNYYGYDSLGNLSGLTDENIHTTVNAFNLFNQPVLKTLPDQTHTETRAYDAAGNLSQLTHFNGAVTTYTYDVLNRLLSRSTPGEATVSFTYTATGKRATMSVGSWNTTYSYDTLDRLTTKAAPAGVLSYSYDGAGNLASMSSNHAHGVLVSYAYDELNRLITVTDSRLLGNQTTTYTYDPASNVATVATPNQLTANFTYDVLNRLTAMTTSVSSYTYTQGPTGNKTGVSEGSGRTISWNYDGIYRLTNETISSDPSQNNGSASYSLDPVGNRLSLNSSLPGIESGGFGYNADDEISSETYDANGNVLATGGKTYTYDSENHMISANNGQVRMIYDGDGNRVAKIVGGVTTQYLVDDLNPTGYAQVVEEVVNGAVTRQYTYGLQRISENQVINNTWTTSFYVYDGGGSVRELTDATGKVTDEYEYDAYGNSFTKQGTTPNNYLYRGEQFDSDLGLYYLRARYYNPATGRFMSRDPEEGTIKIPATLHKYLYASGDPVNRIDPRGRADLFEFDADEQITAEIEATERMVREDAYNGCMEAMMELLGYDYGFDVASGSTLPFAYAIAKGVCAAWSAGML